MLPPRVWGLIPRLASRMRIEQIKAIFSREAAQGFMLSLELHDCEATGFQNEPGNFICRSAEACSYLNACKGFTEVKDEINAPSGSRHQHGRTHLKECITRCILQLGMLLMQYKAVL